MYPSQNLGIILREGEKLILEDKSYPSILSNFYFHTKMCGGPQETQLVSSRRGSRKVPIRRTKIAPSQKLRGMVTFPRYSSFWILCATAYLKSLVP